jgi:REP element-mobilizing transposase RayT
MANEDPLAYFITWVTYGTWLPGDERGWADYHEGWQLPARILEEDSAARMSEDACILSTAERTIVEQQIAETCRYRGWQLHAVQCRSNHVHVVVSAAVDPQLVRDQLKAWCSRRLNEHQEKHFSEFTRTKWWAERGSVRWIWKDASLVRVVEYVVEQQDNRRRYES